jgi:hypothetical protein
VLLGKPDSPSPNAAAVSLDISVSDDSVSITLPDRARAVPSLTLRRPRIRPADYANKQESTYAAESQRTWTWTAADTDQLSTELSQGVDTFLKDLDSTLQEAFSSMSSLDKPVGWAEQIWTSMFGGSSSSSNQNNSNRGHDTTGVPSNPLAPSGSDTFGSWFGWKGGSSSSSTHVSYTSSSFTYENDGKVEKSVTRTSLGDGRTKVETRKRWKGPKGEHNETVDITFE